MSEVHQLSAADAREVRWKNGRGVSREVAVWPEGSAFERGDFGWRVALA
ncbi:MAG TPA: HutD family protein, partial [Planctomycetota bacterium]|nr:HutD family protein [Planctomycetota bacterium]